MTQSSITVTFSLEEILTRLEKNINERFDEVNRKFDEINQKIERLQNDVTDLKVEQAKIAEKIDGLSKRIDNQEFLSRGVLIGLIVVIAGGAAKLFGFIGNP